MDRSNPAHPVDSFKAARGLYIGGTWRAATGGGTIPVLDPATEGVLAEVPDATLAGVFNMGGSAVTSYVSILERAQ